MGKTLVIAEKPSVARDIAGVLGCRQRGDGYLYGDTYIVSWAIGHLVSLCEPDAYDPAYKRWRMETLPIIPQEIKLQALPKTQKQFTILKKLIHDKDVDALICATDSGREGELIFRYIYQLAGGRKPYQRLWISSMTDEALREGFARLKPGSAYDALYLSARCRSEADWLVGINASRAFTIMNDCLLSVGRVQTPTLALLTARQKEIDAFVVKEYWEVQGDHGAFKATYYKKDIQETKLLSEIEAKAIADKVRGKDGIVCEVSKEEKRQLFPQLYDLTELQRDANKRFGFSAQKTLTTAQSLYEKRKLITYPRTDSRYLTHDLVTELKPILMSLQAEPYAGFAAPLLKLPNLPVGKRLVDDSKVADHHAILPTKKKAALEMLSEDERKVYDLVVMRFIAAFYPPYVYELSQIHTLTEGETFYAKGTTIKALGWKEVYSKGMPEEDEEPSLPQLKEGDPVHTYTADVLKKKTTPPKPYNEATLLSAMEHPGRFIEDEELKEKLKDSGLGTPATRAAIIERLIQVGYVGRKGKALIPTPKGMSLIDLVPLELKSPETTGKWERALTSIAKGSMEPEKFMASISRYVQYIVIEASKKNPAILFEKENAPRSEMDKKGQKERIKPIPKETPAPVSKREPLGTCPRCKNGIITANNKGFGCSNYGTGCKFFIGELDKKKLTPLQVKTLLSKGTTGSLKGFRSPKGIPYMAKLKLENETIRILREDD